MTEETKQKQMQSNELTLFQQVAIEGEVANIMKDCETDSEKSYYAFLKLALCDEKYLLVYKNEFMKYIDEVTVHELASYRYMELLPTYLFVQQMAREIKALMGEDCGAIRVMKQPMEVIKSKFIAAMREFLTYVPTTALAILDGLVQEIGEEVDFLPSIAFALRQCVEDSPIEKTVGYDVKIKLLSQPLANVPLLNIKFEEERVAKQVEKETTTPEERANKAMQAISSVLGALINNSSDDEEDEEYAEEATERMVYMVKKIDKSNNQVVFTKEFDTQAQATEYVKNIIKEFPEIGRRFNFAVELVEA